jgi:hypothetical protein
MNAKRVLVQPHVRHTVVAAALSTLIGIGLLNAVTGLFQRDDARFEQLVIAGSACANYCFASERATCVSSHLRPVGIAARIARVRSSCGRRKPCCVWIHGCRRAGGGASLRGYHA